MGCHQSKVEEQVEAPVSTAPAPDAAALAEAPAVEVAPASTTEEAKPEAEVPAVEAEAAVEAPPASSTVSEIPSTEAVASETTPEVAEAAPAPEPVTEEAPAAAAEPEGETVPAAEEAAAEPSVSFAAAGVAVEQNVVYYQFTLTDKEDPAKETTIRKRFNDFKALHAEVAKLMANESNVPVSQGAKFATYPALPALPKAGVSTVLLGRKNKNLTAEREEQFGKILNAIARHPVAFESDAVKSFLV